MISNAGRNIDTSSSEKARAFSAIALEDGPASGGMGRVFATKDVKLWVRFPMLVMFFIVTGWGPGTLGCGKRDTRVTIISVEDKFRIVRVSCAITVVKLSEVPKFQFGEAGGKNERDERMLESDVCGASNWADWLFSAYHKSSRGLTTGLSVRTPSSFGLLEYDRFSLAG